MARKEEKLRPYRVDYFDISEMKDNDKALVRSVVVRSVTANAAKEQVLHGIGADAPSTAPAGRIIIRAYRYYKNLVHKRDVYKAVEDLFTPNKAVKVMEQVEKARIAPALIAAPKNDPFVTDEQVFGGSIENEFEPTAPKCPYGYTKEDEANGAMTAHVCDLHPATEKCTTCGIGIDDNGDGDCAVCVSPAYQQSAGTTDSEKSWQDAANQLEAKCVKLQGPTSPATQEVVADLNGMLNHDAHEQTMDTFVPDSGQPDISKYQQPANTEPAVLEVGNPLHGCVGAPEPVSDQTAAIMKALERTQAIVASRSDEPIVPPTPVQSAEMPLGLKLLLFAGVATILIIFLAAILCSSH